MEISQIVTTFLNLARALTSSGPSSITTIEIGGHRVKIVNGQVVEGSFEEIVRYLMSKDIRQLEVMKRATQKLAFLPGNRILVELIDKAIELKKEQQIAEQKETSTWLTLGLILLIAYAVAGK